MEILSDWAERVGSQLNGREEISASVVDSALASAPIPAEETSPLCRALRCAAQSSVHVSYGTVRGLCASLPSRCPPDELHKGFALQRLDRFQVVQLLRRQVFFYRVPNHRTEHVGWDCI